MTTFFLKTGDAITGPLTAEELKAEGVNPQTLVRLGRGGRWRHLSEILWRESDAVESLEGGLDPDEGHDSRWHLGRIRRFSMVALFIVVGTLWVVADALSIRSYAAWASALVLLCGSAVAISGVLSRRLWAWYLAILVSAALSARLLALTLSSFGVSLAILLGLQLVVTGLLLVWSPRGPALTWAPGLRRLLCLYSKNPKAELRKVSRVSLVVGPPAALVGMVLFIALSVGSTRVHLGNGWSKLLSVSIYLAMVLLAWTLGRRGMPKLSFSMLSGIPRAARTGVVGFLFLSMLLLTGRWLLRAFEVAEYRLATDMGLIDSKITLSVRDAICDVVQRGPSEGTFSLSYALWFYGITLLLGPICEEVFFRGLVFASLRQRWSFWAAAIASGIAFAVPHLFGASWGPATALFLFEIAAGGIAAAFVYELSGSLLAPIVLHMAWNTLQEASSLGG